MKKKTKKRKVKAWAIISVKTKELYRVCPECFKKNLKKTTKVKDKLGAATRLPK